MIKKTYLKDCNKWVISGFNDRTQQENLIKKGFNKKIFKTFKTEQEANKYLKEILKEVFKE